MSPETVSPSFPLISVVSVNIRFDAPEDGAHRWELRYPRLAEALLKTSADIIGTQEGWRRQIQEMHRLLPGYQLVDGHRNWDETKMYPCIFVRPEVFDVLEGRDIWLSRRPLTPGSRSFGSAFPRLITLCRARHRQTGRDVVIGCLHLDHLSGRTRQKQAAVASRQLKKNGAFEAPTLLLGDFNESPAEAVHSLFVEKTSLYDPWERLGLADEATFHGYGAASESQKQRIDWVLATSEFEAQEAGRVESPSPDRYLSDHHPVLFRFHLR